MLYIVTDKGMQACPLIIVKNDGRNIDITLSTTLWIQGPLIYTIYILEHT
jgi:hypothetical protein